jgi:hypothetical protein
VKYLFSNRTRTTNSSTAFFNLLEKLILKTINNINYLEIIKGSDNKIKEKQK